LTVLPQTIAVSSFGIGWICEAGNKNLSRKIGKTRLSD